MSAMWIESEFDVGGRHVLVSVKRVDDLEGERLAAEMAWFAQGLLTRAEDVESAAGWASVLQQILTEHVAITVEEDTLDDLERIWDPLVHQALETFLRVNRLNTILRRYLHTEPTCIS
jgi:hypothetical protein